ncbi:MAG: uroporphyrinogen-III C-methyltransferase [Lachnobacterium sp.]|nr:uroporphyrinogen-III C-methyltransferase [Lachnobacterium sp.]
MGKVILAGAGPGDMGLLTLKAYKYIREADCLVYDRLMSPKLLELARTDCELIYVGKENHKHVVNQDGINEILFQKSKQHELVLRLKGGDPYVFGRGGEEALYLTERGVSVELVPGVSSSIAALADAGIPITHRGVAKGFQVITAHSRKDEEADIDYSLLTDETITCVFLMGLQHVESIAAGLMRAGRREDTPIAVISNGTLPTQNKCVGTLKNIGAKMKEAHLKSPAIIVAGDVVNMSDELDFFEKRPLFGRKFIVPYIEDMGGTEPQNCDVSLMPVRFEAGVLPQDMIRYGIQGYGNRIVSSLEDLGADVLSLKVGRIQPVVINDFERQICSADWLIFTSKNGVKSFFYNMKHAGMDVRKLADCKFAVVGKHTAEELEKHNIYPDFIPDTATGESLAREFCKKILQSDKASIVNQNLHKNADNDVTVRVCLLAAREASTDVESILGNRCDFHKITAYENKALPILNDIFEPIMESDGREIEAVFTSASNVRRMYGALPEQLVISKAYSIGEKTTSALKEQKAGQIIEAEECSYEAILKEIIR